MALIDVIKEDIPLFTSFQQNIENQFEKLVMYILWQRLQEGVIKRQISRR